MHAKTKHATGADDQDTVSAISGDRPSNRRRCICISATVTALAVALLILILALTIFKSKKPITTVNSVTIKDLNATVNLLPFKVSINITLDITISVKNPNRISFTYRNSSAALRYRGHDIGTVPIPGGKIGSEGTKQMNLTLTVFADRLLSDVDVYRDVISGSFPVSTYTRIYGKIRILKLFNVHVRSTSTCDVKIDVLDREIVSQNCHYKNRL